MVERYIVVQVEALQGSSREALRLEKIIEIPQVLIQEPVRYVPKPGFWEHIVEGLHVHQQGGQDEEKARAKRNT